MTRAAAIIDIAKVQLVAWGTIGITQAGVIRLAETVQAVCSALLVVVSLGYAIWKWAKDVHGKN